MCLLFLPLLYVVGIISEFSRVAAGAGGVFCHRQPDFAILCWYFCLYLT